MAALKVSIELSSTWELGPESDSKDLKDILLINKKYNDTIIFYFKFNMSTLELLIMIIMKI